MTLLFDMGSRPGSAGELADPVESVALAIEVVVGDGELVKLLGVCSVDAIWITNMLASVKLPSVAVKVIISDPV